MDLFVVSPLPAALPMAFTCAEQNPPPAADESSQHPFIFHEVSPGEPGIRETTKQQWEFLRPLIQRIYIDENRPFPYLAKILREEHGFQPT
jgi:hypothetical protein